MNSALELTVTINEVVPLVTELKEMDCNVLYMLKPFHKVIDGVFLSDNWVEVVTAENAATLNLQN